MAESVFVFGVEKLRLHALQPKANPWSPATTSLDIIDAHMFAHLTYLAKHDCKPHPLRHRRALCQRQKGQLDLTVIHGSDHLKADALIPEMWHDMLLFCSFP